MGETMEIAKRLESKRIKLGLSYHDIGKALEVAPSTVHRWFKNSSKINVCHVNNICKLLHITPNELVDWDATTNSEVKQLVFSLASSEFGNIPNIDDYVTKEELEEFKNNIKALTSTENNDVRYCHMCGKSAKTYHNFCEKCGTKIFHRNIKSRGIF